MISIRPSSVPDYLKCSAFFANMIEDDDEEVSVPKDCCKLDTSVTNASELEELLRTLRFWGVDRIPIDVIRFAISNNRFVWDSVTATYVADLPMVAQLVRVLHCKREKQVCEAASLRNMDLVSCLIEHGCPDSYVSDKWDDTYAVEIAAENGDLDILKVFNLSSCSQDNQRAASLAAMGGHYACVEYLIKNGCPVAKDLINYAFAGGNLDCLKYLHEALGCAWTDRLFSKLFSPWEESNQNSRPDEQNLLQCLEYAQVTGCPQDINACFTCALWGVSLLLQHLHESGWPWSENVVDVAARQGDLDCLKYAMENGCPHHPEGLMWVGLLSGKVDIVQYLHDRGVPWAEEELRYFDQDTEDAPPEIADALKVCLLYAYKLGCPRDPKTCMHACKFGWYDLLVDAHQHGCEWDKYCSRNAAYKSHLDCLMYLHEHGCEWHEENCMLAAGNGNIDCLKYLVEHGCPVTSDAYSCAVSSGSAEIVQYLHDKGVAWPDEILLDFRGVYRGFYQKDDKSATKVCLELAYQLGCPRDVVNTCYVASAYGWYDILVDAHQHGCEWDSFCAQQAIANGHFDCLKYLHEHGCPWQSGTIVGALRSANCSSWSADYYNAENCTEHEITNREAQRDKFKECLIYAVEHGCPLPATIEDNYCWPKDEELQQYLIDKGCVPPKANSTSYGFGWYSRTFAAPTTIDKCTSGVSVPI